MPQVRSMSACRNIRDLDRHLKERLEPSKGALGFSIPTRGTAWTPSSDPLRCRTSLHPPAVQRIQPSSVRRTHSARSTRSVSSAQAAITVLPAMFTRAATGSVAAHCEVALHIAREVSKQSPVVLETRREQTHDPARLAIERRYNMVVNEGSILAGADNDHDDGDGSAATSASASPQRGIRQVEKGGLRSDYYVPTRKHTMHALQARRVVPRERVHRVAAKWFIPPGRGKLTYADIDALIALVGPQGPLGEIALIDRRFAAAVDAKLQQLDRCGEHTSAQDQRVLLERQMAVRRIPRAFLNAIAAMAGDPPARIAVPLAAAVVLIEKSSRMNDAPVLSTPAALAVLRGYLNAEGPESVVDMLASLDPTTVPVDAIRAVHRTLHRCARDWGVESVADVVPAVEAASPHAGTLLQWVLAILRCHANAAGESPSRKDHLL